MKICVHPAFALYLLCVGIFGSWQTCVSAIFALALHEAGHCALCLLFREPIAKVELTPFGGMITYAPGKCASKGVRGLCIAAAGPLANYLALLVLPAMQAKLGQTLTRHFATAHASMLCLNLLPVLPLDGGAIVLSVGYYLFPVAKLVSLLTASGIVCGMSLAALSIYGAWTLGMLNCSLMIVGCYLAICAQRSRPALLAENLFTVIQEHQEESAKVRKIQMYRIAPDTRTIDLLKALTRCEYAGFIFEQDGKERVIGEREACQLLLNHPMISVCEAVKLVNAQENADSD